MSDRLKSAIAARKLTVNDLMERTDISKSGLYFILDGTTNPDKVRFSTVSDICKALRINTDWLMHGFGDMEAGRLPQSQSVRIDADTIADAQDALKAVAKVNGVPPGELSEWVNDPYRLALAIDAVQMVKASGQDIGNNIIDLMAKIAERMRSGGKDAVESIPNAKGGKVAVKATGKGKD
jgi:DNA-binding Xre family transcriptional regulator